FVLQGLPRLFELFQRILWGFPFGGELVDELIEPGPDLFEVGVVERLPQLFEDELLFVERAVRSVGAARSLPLRLSESVVRARQLIDDMLIIGHRLREFDELVMGEIAHVPRQKDVLPERPQRLSGLLRRLVGIILRSAEFLGFALDRIRAGDECPPDLEPAFRLNLLVAFLNRLHLILEAFQVLGCLRITAYADAYRVLDAAL